jgi:hypothetical protein
MFGDVYQLILGAMILMIIGTLSAFYIYYKELMAEKKEIADEIKKESTELVDKLKKEIADRDASANKAINLSTDNIPTDWMSATLSNITSGRLFRITNPIFSYVDASNNGDAICKSFDSKATLAEYSHLRYAYSKDASGVRRDASANWCEYAWGRGGKTSADGLAFKMADSAYASKYPAACGADSSGIHVLNAYKWTPDAKMGLVCYTPNAKVQSDSSKQPPEFSGSQLTATYENFSGSMDSPVSFVGNVKKALNNMLSPILPDFATTKESFITYDSQSVPVFSDSAFNATTDGKYALF